MSHKRPTEASWDSDEEPLDENMSAVHAFPVKKEGDDELDEDALLGYDEDLIEEVAEDQLNEEDVLELIDVDDVIEISEPIELDEDDTSYSTHDQSVPSHDDSSQSFHHSQHDASVSSSNDTYETTAEYTEAEGAYETVHDLSQHQDGGQSQQQGDLSQNENVSKEESNIDVNDDEESESDDEERARRGRFTSERVVSGTVVSLKTSGRKEIPDTLPELSLEEQAKVDSFMGNKKQRKKNRNNMNNCRNNIQQLQQFQHVKTIGKPVPYRMAVPHQQFQHNNQPRKYFQPPQPAEQLQLPQPRYHSPQPQPLIYSSPAPMPLLHCTSAPRPLLHSTPAPRPLLHSAPAPRPLLQPVHHVMPPQPTPSRKILINPHFRHPANTGSPSPWNSSAAPRPMQPAPIHTNYREIPNNMHHQPSHPPSVHPHPTSLPPTNWSGPIQQPHYAAPPRFGHSVPVVPVMHHPHKLNYPQRQAQPYNPPHNPQQLATQYQGAPVIQHQPLHHQNHHHQHQPGPYREPQANIMHQHPPFHAGSPIQCGDIRPQTIPSLLHSSQQPPHMRNHPMDPNYCGPPNSNHVDRGPQNQDFNRPSQNRNGPFQPNIQKIPQPQYENIQQKKPLQRLPVHQRLGIRKNKLKIQPRPQQTKPSPKQEIVVIEHQRGGAEQTHVIMADVEAFKSGSLAIISKEKSDDSQTIKTVIGRTTQSTQQQSVSKGVKRHSIEPITVESLAKKPTPALPSSCAAKPELMVDEDYSRKLEEQKQMREEIKLKKERRRMEQADERKKLAEISATAVPKPTPEPATNIQTVNSTTTSQTRLQHPNKLGQRYGKNTAVKRNTTSNLVVIQDGGQHHPMFHKQNEEKFHFKGDCGDDLRPVLSTKIFQVGEGPVISGRGRGMGPQMMRSQQSSIRQKYARMKDGRLLKVKPRMMSSPPSLLADALPQSGHLCSNIGMRQPASLQHQHPHLTPSITAPKRVVNNPQNMHPLFSNQAGSEAAGERLVMMGRGRGHCNPKRVVLGQHGGANYKNRQVLQPMARMVSIENLSSATSAANIRQLCSKIGPIEGLKYDVGSQKAIVMFETAERAFLFVKMYNRKMVDLSHIQVRLLSG